ncbi:hypothetical protein HJFPF1_04655 [Paramyrothecium foliicola]|nr:hypothetical protein HJFPF1_04655 [Paramyrothecium foliicola]
MLVEDDQEASKINLTNPLRLSAPDPLPNQADRCAAATGGLSVRRVKSYGPESGRRLGGRAKPTICFDPSACIDLEIILAHAAIVD